MESPLSAFNVAKHRNMGIADGYPFRHNAELDAPWTTILLSTPQHSLRRHHRIVDACCCLSSSSEVD